MAAPAAVAEGWEEETGFADEVVFPATLVAVCGLLAALPTGRLSAAPVFLFVVAEVTVPVFTETTGALLEAAGLLDVTVFVLAGAADGLGEDDPGLAGDEVGVGVGEAAFTAPCWLAGLALPVFCAVAVAATTVASASMRISFISVPLEIIKRTPLISQPATALPVGPVSAVPAQAQLPGHG